jgi:hypothetical protein
MARPASTRGIGILDHAELARMATTSNPTPPRRSKALLPGCLLGAAGVLLIIGSNALFWGSMLLSNDRIAQIRVPGEATIELAEAAELQVAFETIGTIDGVPYRAARPQNEPIVTFVADDGSVTALKPTSIRQTFSLPGRVSVTMGVLPVTAAGRGTVIVAERDPAIPSGGTVIIEPAFDFSGLVLLMASVVVGASAAMAGLLLCVVRLSKR